MNMLYKMPILIYSTFLPCFKKLLINAHISDRLDGRHVVFGKVLSGMDVVYKMEAEGNQSGTPKSKVVIADSGELPL